mgnify:CR=1 FL=1
MGAKGLPESYYNDELVLKIFEHLKKDEDKFKVVLTRPYKQTFLQKTLLASNQSYCGFKPSKLYKYLKTQIRSCIANHENANVFISIHHDSLPGNYLKIVRKNKKTYSYILDKFFKENLNILLDAQLQSITVNFKGFLIDKLKKYDPKILLVATKIDKTQNRVISSEELKNYAQAKQFPCIETSVKENRNVTEAFAVGASLHINKEDLTTKQKPSLATRTISAEFKLMDRLVFSYYANICETSFYSSHEDRENTIENLIKKMGAFKADYLSKDAQLNSEDYQKIADWVKEAIRETKISHFTHSWWARKGVTHSRLATALERYLKEIQPFLIADKEDVKPEEPKKIESATNGNLTLASRYGS